MAALKIIHVDMDAFFAAIEIRDNPELKDKPVIIGSDNPRARGVVSTASYEARKYGVRSAMPITEAYRRCPHGIFLGGNMEKYQKVSRQIIDIFYSYTPLVEPISLDEAFLDISGCEGLFGSPEEIALKIKKDVKDRVGLVASLGIAQNKFLAKLASDLEKPDGLVIIPPERVQLTLDKLPVEKLWGVGEKTAEILKGRGIHYIGQIARMNVELLENQLGSTGRLLWQLARGIDDRPVITEHEVKSVGREYTFKKDTCDINKIESVLFSLCEDVGRRLRNKQVKGRVITVKLRFKDFKTHTRQRTLKDRTNLGSELFREARKILRSFNPEGSYFRLIGVSISHLERKKNYQPTLFGGEKRKKEEKMAEVVDRLKNKYGEEIIVPARLWELKED